MASDKKCPPSSKRTSGLRRVYVGFASRLNWVCIGLPPPVAKRHHPNVNRCNPGMKIQNKSKLNQELQIFMSSLHRLASDLRQVCVGLRQASADGRKPTQTRHNTTQTRYEHPEHIQNKSEFRSKPTQTRHENPE